MSTLGVPVHLTVGAVLLASALLQRVAQTFGQPEVVREIFAGLMVGVALNLVGATFGDSSSTLAHSTAATLDHIGSIGLVFMVVNALFHAPPTEPVEGNTSGRRAVLVVTLANSIPALLAGGWLATQYAVAHELTATPAFVLLVGAAMSISAVPVLARIMSELGLESSIVGRLAFRAACWTDVIGWVLVGLALSFQQHANTSRFLITRAMLVASIFLALLCVRTMMVRLRSSPATTNQVVLIALLISAGLTQVASLHLVFGGFLVGSVFASSTSIRKNWLLRTSWITNRFFCPVFFAIAGMSLLSSGGVSSSELGWGAGFLILCIGTKLVPLMVAGRWIGLSGPESILLGLLLNTRGLMELVILSVGLSAGIFSSLQYSIFVLVAIVTTVMSAPLCRLAQNRLNLPSPLQSEPERSQP